MNIWKTVKIKKMTAEQLEKAGFKISDLAKELLAKTTFKKETLDLEVISVAELGFPNGATKEQIYNRAEKRGLDLCPASVGPVLRMEYKDQPVGEWFSIGMKPIVASGGRLRVFRVECDGGGHWLG